MKKAFLPIAFTLPILLSACGGENALTDVEQASEEQQVVGKSLRMSLDLGSLQAVGIASDKVVVTITKGEFSQTLEISHTDYSATAEFSNLALGDYQVNVQIFDGETVVAEGSGMGTVSINQLASVDLKLELMSGGLAINVCVPDLHAEGLYEKTLNLAVVQQAALSEIAGELAAGASPEYVTSLSYSELALEQGLQVDLQLLGSFTSEDAETKSIQADENTLTISSEGGELLSANACNQKVSLKYADFVVSNGLFGENTEKQLRLIVDIPVEEVDYMHFGGEVVDRDGDINGVPYYRNIDRVSASIIFKHVSGGMGFDAAFESANLVELFDSSNFTHSLELEAHNNNGDELAEFSVVVGGIEIPRLAVELFKAE